MKGRVTKFFTIGIAAAFLLNPLGGLSYGASFFDGLPKAAIDWIKDQAKKTHKEASYDSQPRAKVRYFDGRKVRINFQERTGREEYEEWDIMRGGSIDESNAAADTYYHVWIDDGKRKAYGSYDDIKSALDKAVPAESTTSTQDSTTTTTTVPVLDANRDDEPLVSSQTPIASSDRAGIRLVKNVTVPQAVTKSEKQDQAAAAEATRSARLVGGTVSYEDFEYRGMDGETYEFLAGLEKAIDEDIILGFYVPLSYVDVTGGDWQKAGVTGYIKKLLTPRENIDASLGLAAYFENTFMDFGNIDDSLSYGAGPMASATLLLNVMEISVGSGILFTGNTKYDSANIVTTGVNLGVPLGDNVVVNGYAYRNDNLEESADYYIFGLTASVMVSETFGLSVGVETVEELDDFDSIMYYLGSGWYF